MYVYVFMDVCSQRCVLVPLQVLSSSLEISEKCIYISSKLYICFYIFIYTHTY